MKRAKRILSALLCAVLACSPAALTANAAGELGEGKYTRETAGGDIASFGWEGDKHAPIAYRDGAYLLRDRGDLIVDFGVAGVDARNIDWYNKEGYLPCFVSEYSKNNMDFTVENFADKVEVVPPAAQGESHEVNIINPDEKYPATNGWTFGDVNWNGKRLQTFTSPSDGKISDLQVILVKWGEGEHGNLHAALYLSGEEGAPAGEALQEITVAAADVQNGTFTKLPFDCSVTEGTRYSLVLWQETLNPDAHYRWGYVYDPGKGDPYEDEYAGGLTFDKNAYHREDKDVGNNAMKVTVTEAKAESYTVDITNPNEKYPATNGWTFGDVNWNGKRVQTFTSPADGKITDLEVILVKWGEGEHSDLHAALYVSGEEGAPAGEALQEITVAAADVQNGTFTKLPFDCGVSEGARYSLVLWQETLNPDAHYRWGYVYDPGKGDPYEDEYAGGMTFDKNAYHREDKDVGNNATRITVQKQAQTEARDYVVAYSRLTVKNNNESEQALPVVSEELIPLNDAAKNRTTIAAGETVVLDYAIGADRFGNTYFYPDDDVIAALGGFDSHYAHMKEYWNNRLEGVIDIEKLPAGYEKLIDAYKAGYIYNFIVADGDELNVGENNYDRVFDHDCIGQMAALIVQGDYAKFKEYNAHVFDTPQYRDAEWKYSWPIALYLQKSGDLAYVQEQFEDIKTHTHTIEEDREDNGTGIMKKTWGIDLWGHWLIDNWSALTGLTTYQYLCEQLGEESEAAWAEGQYSSLMAAVTEKLSETMEWNGFNYLPAAVTQDNDGHRCDRADDANWASHLLFGRWAWEGYLFGANQEDNMMIDRIDETYTYGFQRLEKLGYPAYTFGGFPGVCSAYNAGYGSSALRGELYRDVGIKAYMFMIENTQNGPYSWWEFIDNWDNHSFDACGGSCQHMWGQSTASKVLVDSLISEKFDGSVIIGRGVPTEWIADGEEIVVNNAPISNNKRMGFTLSTSGKEVTLALTGDRGTAPLTLELMSFKDNIEAVQGGSFDEASGVVTVDAGVSTVVVTLKEAGSSTLYEAKKELTISAQKAQNDADETKYTQASVDVVDSYAQKAIETAASNDATLEEVTRAQNELNAAKDALERRDGSRLNFGYIPSTGADIAIDGQMDDAYQDALTIKVAKGSSSERLVSSELTAEAKFLWKDGELYVHVSIDDGNLITSYNQADLDNIFAYIDSCELYLEAGAAGEFEKTMRFRVDVTGGVSVIDQNGIWETTPEGCKPYLDYAVVLDEENNKYAVEFKVKQLLDPIEEGDEIGVFFRVIDKINQGYGAYRSWYTDCNRLGGPWQPEYYSKATIGTADPSAVKKDDINTACERAEAFLKHDAANSLTASQRIDMEMALSKALSVSNDTGSFQNDVDAAFAGLMTPLYTATEAFHTELRTEIEKAEALDLTGCTPKTIQALKDAIDDARFLAVHVSASSGDAAEMLAKLAGAQEGLAKKGNKGTLNQSIAYGDEQMANPKYENVIPSSKKLFEAKLAAAKVVSADENATQNDVDTAYLELLDAIGYLDLFQGDKAELEKVIAMAEGTNLDDYTSHGKEEFNKALADAKKVVDDEDAIQETVDEAVKTLRQAIAGLTPKGDKYLLRQAIAIVRALDLSKYADSGKEELQSALQNAVTVEADDDADENAVNAATERLNAALFAMRKLANKDNLEEVIKKAEALNPDDYTPQSYQAVANAYLIANLLMNTPNLTEDAQDKIDAAAKALDDAIEALVKASGSEDDPSGSEKPDDGNSSTGKPDDGNSGQTGGDKTPTGDSADFLYTLLFALLILAAAGTGLLVKTRKKLN